MKKMKFSLAVAGLVAASQLTGCLSIKAYVDPAYKNTSYSDIKRPSQPIPVVLTTEFQRNGVVIPRAAKELQSAVERSLRATGVFSPTESNTNTQAKLYLTANNVADLGEAAGKGVLTGLTFGAVGNAVTDKYEFKFKYVDAQGKETSQRYPHMILTTVGNKKAPVENVQPMAINEAFNKVIDDVVIRFTYDLQK
ncbi:hypothetical protein F4U02_04955 [Acinetobacter haemolyticus]|uniref:Lipoprotein n=1 Tax=Acinetobacter haemolyticus CIP 64.3 = MTCC 9819 TaxID=1217659 RepID=N9GT29_ACIHA|nr:hypothetical protein [Acinetobacter haemolyticus]ENW20249.1 hypothetical protein F927_00729 [Acinetobacter haemolyticus CIP 64.3 = MTCC 9819]EPR88737.1 hypothetical protein L313_2112 [Acinetobacter haemolyticus CIP 64.3 = MTCC 9819]MQZ30353.1 hypothetical protein [Acinetobacter haemolyticus]QXZ27794.1 hypothetical protein I6L22_05840 [Acinetobacter haemolyticus]RSN76402.1 hypothetical protein EA769_08120 [Acinetobacter haemolyticus]